MQSKVSNSDHRDRGQAGKQILIKLTGSPRMGECHLVLACYNRTLFTDGPKSSTMNSNLDLFPDTTSSGSWDYDALALELFLAFNQECTL